MKNDKMHTKLILAVCLAIVLTVTCVLYPTFSWFSRPESKTGNALLYTVPAAATVNAYDGSGVTMETFVSTNDGLSFTTVHADPVTSKDLAPGERLYYKTVITNGNQSKNQNVSLYINNLVTGNTGNCCVGTNVPVKSFKNYTHYNVVLPSPSKTAVKGNTTKRMYFKPGDHENWSNSGSYQMIIWDDGGSNKRALNFNNTTTTGVFYVDVPEATNSMYIRSDTTSTVGAEPNYKRSQTFTNLSGDGLTKTSSICLKFNGNYNGYNNAILEKESETITGANICNYYNVINMRPISGYNSMNLGLTSGTDYIGSTLTYTSGNTNIFTVTPSGAIAAVAQGSATLTYRATSQYGDYVEKSVTVIIKASAESQTIKAAPIVTNLLIPAATQENVQNHKNVQEVYWFIQNGDEMYAASNENVSYTLSGIYLGV